MPVVLTGSRDRALVVAINRPEARNAVDGETAGLLFDAVQAFKADDALDALILTGAGDPSAGSGQAAFCAGADLKGGAGLMARPGAQESGPMGFSRITDVDKPTIAAVNGYCLAGGLGLVQEVVPKGGALGRALELARAISTYPQLSLRNDRRAAIEGLTLPLPEGLELERRLHEASLADPAMVEGLGRYAAGDRPPPPRGPG